MHRYEHYIQFSIIVLSNIDECRDETDNKRQHVKYWKFNVYL